MNSFISSERYTRQIDAALAVLASSLEGSPASLLRTETLSLLDQARAAVELLRTEVPTAAEAFDSLVGPFGRVSAILTNLERDAWRQEQPLAQADHQSAANQVLDALREMCLHIIGNEALSLSVYTEAESLLTSSQLLPRLTKSFEKDGKAGEYRSQETDDLLYELRTTLEPLIASRMGLDLTLQEY